MQGDLTRIELCGVLGQRFGKEHYRMISTTSEAVRSLCCTIKGFEIFLNNSKCKMLTFAIFRGDRNINQDELKLPVCGDVIKIIPVIIGSKKAGGLQTILGAVLVVVGVIFSFTPAAAASPFLYKLGASLMLGGVIQMLSPQMPGLASKQATENKPSYAFGGVTNTAAQGYPVPLLYGKRRIGGAIISAGIYVEDQQ